VPGKKTDGKKKGYAKKLGSGSSGGQEKNADSKELTPRRTGKATTKRDLVGVASTHEDYNEKRKSLKPTKCKKTRSLPKVTPTKKRQVEDGLGTLHNWGHRGNWAITTTCARVVGGLFTAKTTSPEMGWGK